MENDKDKKIREPFPPEETPSPPQEIDPSEKRGKKKDDKKGGDKGR